MRECILSWRWFSFRCLKPTPNWHILSCERIGRQIGPNNLEAVMFCEAIVEYTKVLSIKANYCTIQWNVRERFRLSRSCAAGKITPTSSSLVCPKIECFILQCIWPLCSQSFVWVCMSVSQSIHKGIACHSPTYTHHRHKMPLVTHIRARVYCSLAHLGVFMCASVCLWPSAKQKWNNFYWYIEPKYSTLINICLTLKMYLA